VKDSHAGELFAVAGAAASSSGPRGRLLGLGSPAGRSAGGGTQHLSRAAAPAPSMARSAQAGSVRARTALALSSLKRPTAWGGNGPPAAEPCSESKAD